MIAFSMAVGLLAITNPVIFAIDPEALERHEQTTAAVLQGLVAKGEPLIWLRTDEIQAELLRIRQEEGVRIDSVGLWEAVEQFRHQLQGYILFELDDESLNVATSLAGPWNALAITADSQSQAEALDLEMLFDARGWTEEQAWREHQELFARGMVIEQVLDKHYHLRDYAVKHNLFVIDAHDREFRREVMAALGPDVLALGWSRSEQQWIEDVTLAGGTGVPADWCLNLSVLESWETNLPLVAPPSSGLTLEDGKRYVAFVLSDGDNLQWMMSGFGTSERFYGSPLRGELPFTWEVSPLLTQFAPRILEWIYAEATPLDDFVTGPGLPGYAFASQMPDRERMARQSQPFLRDSGLSLLTFLNANDSPLEDLLPWVNLDETDAVLYKEWAPYHRPAGRILWVGEKPIIGYRFILWEGLLEINALAREINAMGREGDDRFATVNVHAWSFEEIGGPLDAVAQVAAQFDDDVVLVTASQLVNLMRQQRSAGRSPD